MPKKKDSPSSEEKKKKKNLILSPFKKYKKRSQDESEKSESFSGDKCFSPEHASSKSLQDEVFHNPSGQSLDFNSPQKKKSKFDLVETLDSTQVIDMQMRDFSIDASDSHIQRGTDSGEVYGAHSGSPYERAPNVFLSPRSKKNQSNTPCKISSGLPPTQSDEVTHEGTLQSAARSDLNLDIASSKNIGIGLSTPIAASQASIVTSSVMTMIAVEESPPSSSPKSLYGSPPTLSPRSYSGSANLSPSKFGCISSNIFGSSSLGQRSHSGSPNTSPIQTGLPHTSPSRRGLTCTPPRGQPVSTNLSYQPDFRNLNQSDFTPIYERSLPGTRYISRENLPGSTRTSPSQLASVSPNLHLTGSNQLYQSCNRSTSTSPNLSAYSPSNLDRSTTEARVNLESGSYHYHARSVNQELPYDASFTPSSSKGQTRNPTKFADAPDERCLYCDRQIDDSKILFIVSSSKHRTVCIACYKIKCLKPDECNASPNKNTEIDGSGNIIYFKCKSCISTSEISCKKCKSYIEGPEIIFSGTFSKHHPVCNKCNKYIPPSHLQDDASSSNINVASGGYGDINIPTTSKSISRSAFYKPKSKIFKDAISYDVTKTKGKKKIETNEIDFPGARSPERQGFKQTLRKYETDGLRRERETLENCQMTSSNINPHEESENPPKKKSYGKNNKGKKR